MKMAEDVWPKKDIPMFRKVDTKFMKWCLAGN